MPSLRYSFFFAHVVCTHEGTVTFWLSSPSNNHNLFPQSLDLKFNRTCSSPLPLQNSLCQLIPCSQHTHAQPHKNPNLSVFNQLEMIYLNRSQTTRMKKTRVVRSGKNKASFCTVFLHFVVLMLCFIFLTLFSLFSSLVESS